jgi:tripartite-type tricarboxylate transporter receptor subunit TctC
MTYLNIWRCARSGMACGVALVGLLTAAFAQSYPARPITLIVPFPPGGIIDGTARIIEPALSKELGQPIVIENKGGSGGNIGTALAARAAADGYTLLMVPNAVVVMNPFTFKNYPIDPVKDLAPIGMVGESYLGLVVPAASPFNSVQDVVAAAKAKPGELTYGHIGVGSGHNIAGSLLNKKAEINITPVPFQGAGPAMQSVLGGHISMSYGTLAGILPYVQSKQMKLLGIAEPKRIKSMPEVPTIHEIVPGVLSPVWVAVFVSGGTPADVVAKLNAALNKTLDLPDVQQKLERIGVVLTPGAPDALAQRVRDDLKFWREAIPLAGITPQ